MAFLRMILDEMDFSVSENGSGKSVDRDVARITGRTYHAQYLTPCAWGPITPPLPHFIVHGRNTYNLAPFLPVGSFLVIGVG
jgi:hypothetical protein